MNVAPESGFLRTQLKPAVDESCFRQHVWGLARREISSSHLVSSTVSSHFGFQQVWRDSRKKPDELGLEQLVPLLAGLAKWRAVVITGVDDRSSSYGRC